MQTIEHTYTRTGNGYWIIKIIMYEMFIVKIMVLIIMLWFGRRFWGTGNGYALSVVYSLEMDIGLVHSPTGKFCLIVDTGTHTHIRNAVTL